MFRQIALSVLFTLLIPEVADAAPPRASKSEYLTTKGAGFVLAKGEGAIYAMTFGVNKELTGPLYVSVSFENPGDRKSPFQSTATLSPGQQELVFQSPPIKKIKTGGRYTVDVFLYADEARTRLVGRHSQKVAFDMPREMAAQFGIEKP